MSRIQFLMCLAVVGTMSMAGGFAAIAVLQGDGPLHAEAETDGVKDVLRAHAFELVDDSGQVRAKVDVSDENSVRFTLLDEQGMPRLMLAADKQDASVSLLDRKGNPRAVLAESDKNKQVSLSFLDAKQQPRLLQSFDDDGNLMVAFQNPDGSTQMSLLGNPKHSSLILADNKGHNIASLTGGADQPSSMQLYDPKGNGGVLLSTLSDGRSLFALSKDDKLRLRAMCGEDGTPELIFLNEDREATWRAGKSK